MAGERDIRDAVADTTPSVESSYMAATVFFDEHDSWGKKPFGYLVYFYDIWHNPPTGYT